jgi:hypothetical protein
MMQMSIKIEPDVDGYTGRECPSCKKYFKIKGGTGLPGSPPCHCPYCNHVGSPNEFFTEDQIEYAKSVVLNKFSAAFLASLKTLERRPDPRAFISIGIKISGSPEPVIHYSEQELEERVTCSACTLQYAIYGAFGYCPDCGVHNSLQIVNANLDLTVKLLDSQDRRQPMLPRSSSRMRWKTPCRASMVSVANIVRGCRSKSRFRTSKAREISCSRKLRST